MDINLSKEKMNYVKNVLAASLTHEETMEMIVPDALPDILRIVDTDANAFLRSKSTDTGRVTVSGVAEVTVLYAPDGESGVRKLDLEMPFTLGATESEITPASRVTAVISVSSADASMANPRKIIARVNLLADIGCYNDAELLLSGGLEDDNDAGIEVLTDNLDVTTTTGVREKTFVINEELTVPGANPPVGTILKYRANIDTDDTKVVGNKLILRGTANVAVLYLPSDGGDIAQVEFSPEFSQILELDNIAPNVQAGDSSFSISLMLTNAYFDSEASPHNTDGRILTMELHAVAQCVSSEKMSISYISDMYSTKYALEPAMKDYSFDNRSKSKTSAVFHGVLETPSPASRVIALTVHPGTVTQTDNSEGVLALKCPLNVSAIYAGDDGRILSSSRSFDTDANTDSREGSKYSATASCGKDLYGVAAGNGIELRIPVELTIHETTQMQLNMFESLSYDENAPLDNSKLPSLIVTRTAKDDSLWQLAKKHRSTQKLIMAANGIEKEENVAAGQVLIIPKK